MPTLKELYQLVRYRGLPASRYTPAEIDARIAKLDSTLMALGDAALEFTRFLDQVYQQDDPSLALTPEVLAELANEEQDIGQRFAFLFEQRGFLADYQILLTPTYHNEEQRKDAAGRMADRLEKAGPFAPNARLALKKAASIHNRDWKELLRETIVAAVWLVARQSAEPETIREGEQWVKDSVGDVAEVIPARQYGPGSEQFRHWFELRVRTLVEKEVPALAGEQPPEKPKKDLPSSITAIPKDLSYKPLDVDETVGAEGIPNPVMAGLARLFTPEDRALLERAELGNLDAADRKRLERLRRRAERFRKVL